MITFCLHIYYILYIYIYLIIKLIIIIQINTITYNVTYQCSYYLFISFFLKKVMDIVQRIQIQRARFNEKYAKKRAAEDEY